jgi:uncharacterized protein YaiL (DUF2058 family)
MSLREQLFKAGLISKKQAQKVEAINRKQGHDSKKNKQLEAQLNAQKKEELENILQEQNQRKQLDKELNHKRDLFIQERENIYRIRQILNSNSLNDRNAQELYFFLEGKYVRKVSVTPWQREMLARGKMGIGRPVEGVDEFVIIPLAAAKIVQDICPQKLLTLHSELPLFVELEDCEDDAAVSSFCG